MPLFKVTVSEQVARESTWLVRAVDEEDAKNRYHAGERALLREEDVDAVEADVESVEVIHGEMFGDHELPPEEGLVRLEVCDEDGESSEDDSPSSHVRSCAARYGGPCTADCEAW